MFALVAAVVFTGTAQAQVDSHRDFSGSWKLNDGRTELRNPLPPLDSTLRVEQSGIAMKVSAGGATLIYPLNGKSEKSRVADTQYGILTKWEGDALLANVIVSGPENFSIAERWEKSRDGSRLFVSRTFVTRAGESESKLVYENPATISRTHVSETPSNDDARPVPPPPVSVVIPPGQRPAPVLSRRDAPPPVPAGEEDYVVARGSRILLRLTNSLNTKRSVAGDRVYLETAVPVFVRGRMVIPSGAYVTGTVTEAQRAGKVKGKSSMNLQFDTLTLKTGVSRDLRSRPGSVDGGGSLDRSEGRIQGEGSTGHDVGTVAKTGAAGAGLGSIIGLGAGHAGMGAGIGGAAGAVAGLAGVLGSRGHDVVLPVGTTMEMVVDHDLHFSSSELNRIE